MIELKAKHSLNHDKKIFNKIDFSGFEFSKPDPRDYTEEIAFAKLGDVCEEILPDEYIALNTPILNQGSVGSCVAHAIATMLAQGDLVVFGDAYEYSRGFIYGNREPEQYQGEGMRTNEALKQVNHYGDCVYEDFPYNEKYDVVKQLIASNKEALYLLAEPYKLNSYYRCNNNNEIKRAVYRNGGVVIAIRVYEDFSRDLHKSKSFVPRGGHAMVIVGWTNDGRWIVQNSWGADWGYGGKLFMDFDYPISEAWGVITCQERPKPIDPEPEPEPKPEPEPEPSKPTFIQAIVELFKKIIDAIVNIFKKK